VLYLRGFSTGNFQETLSALLGADAPNLSPAVISRPTAEWKEEYTRWQKHDLSAHHYVYCLADCVHGQARMQEYSDCMLVLLGATPEVAKNLSASKSAMGKRPELARSTGRPESRGRSIAPEVSASEGGSRLLEGGRRDLPQHASPAMLVATCRHPDYADEWMYAPLRRRRPARRWALSEVKHLDKTPHSLPSSGSIHADRSISNSCSWPAFEV
jgi:Transposase, Mutator family